MYTSHVNRLPLDCANLRRDSDQRAHIIIICYDLFIHPLRIFTRLRYAGDITKSNYRKLSCDIDFVFYPNPNRCPSQKPNPYPNPNHNLTDVIKIGRFQPKGKL